MAIQLSRSEQKRRIKEIEQLVHQLIVLPKQDIETLPCDTELIALCIEAGSMQGGAKKRHIKYITKLLKNQPLGDLYAIITQKKGKTLQQNRIFHELEYLRDTLLDEAIEQRKMLRSEQKELAETWESQTLVEIQKILPVISPLALGRLAAIFARTRQPKYSREIFRLLRAAREQMDRKSLEST